MQTTEERRPGRRRETNYCAECSAACITTRHPVDYGHTTCHTCRAENPVSIAHIDGEDRADRQLRAMRAMGEIETPKPAPKKPVCVDIYTSARRRFHAVFNRHFPKATREQRLTLCANYLRRDVDTTGRLTRRELSDLATDIELQRVGTDMLGDYATAG